MGHSVLTVVGNTTYREHTCLGGRKSDSELWTKVYEEIVLITAIGSMLTVGPKFLLYVHVAV
jgi:hypothetical protein